MTSTRMKFAALVAVLVGLSVAMPAFAADKETAYERVMRTGTIKCGYLPWPMYFDVDPNTKALSGIAKDLSDATFKLLGLKVEYVEYNLSNKVQDLKSGKVDAICGDGPWVLTTIKQVNYTAPFFYVPVYAYVRQDEKRFATASDLNKKDVKFVGIDGDISTELVQNNYSAAALDTLPSTDDASELLLGVANKKADVTILDPGAATNYIKNNPGKLKLLFEKPQAIYAEGFSTAKGEIELFNTLNQGVMALHNIGGVDPILKKYDPDGKTFLKIAPYAIQK